MSERETEYLALAGDVLAVAKQGGKGDDWAAYIGAVPGISHRREWRKVLENGDKLPYNVAKVLFPAFDAKYEWRP